MAPPLAEVDRVISAVTMLRVKSAETANDKVVFLLSKMFQRQDERGWDISVYFYAELDLSQRLDTREND